MPHNYKHTIKKYTNTKEYITEDVWVLIPRITEICNTLTCMFPAYQNDVNRVARGEKPFILQSTSYPALRGVLTHYDIEVFVDTQLGVETPSLELRTAENMLLAQIEEMGSYDDMMDEVSAGFDTFTKWWEMYDPVPLFSEQEMVHISYDSRGMVDPTRSVKGTIDFVGELHLDRLSRNALIEMKKTKSKTEWEILEEKSTALVDWKSGKQEQLSHGVQLSGYDFLSTESGWWDLMIEEKKIKYPKFKRSIYDLPRVEALCVKTGNRKPLTTFYDVEDHKDFFRAWDLFNESEPTTWSDKQGKFIGLKQICMFCEYRNNGCPLFVFNKGVIET